jgi:putative peptidoglycan lipid II flippase
MTLTDNSPTGDQSTPLVTQRIARRTAIMSLGTVLSRVTGLARVLAIIYALGATRLADTYNLANNLPNVMYELLLGGVLSATMIPVFTEITDRGKKDRDPEAIRAIFTLTLIVAVAASFVVALFAPWIIGAYTVANSDADAQLQREVGTTLLRLFAAQITFYGLTTLTIAYLNAKRRFAAPMFTPILNNIVVIGVLLSVPSFINGVRQIGDTDDSLLRAQQSANGLLWLGLGTTAGVASVSIAMLFFAIRAGLPLRPRLDPRHPAVVSIIRLSGWTVAFVIANQLCLLIITAFANKRAGDVSIYQYTYNFFLLPHGIFAVSVMSALLPELSDSWRNGQMAAFRDMAQRGIRLISFVLIPAAVGIAIVAAPLLSLALRTNDSSQIVSDRAADTLRLLVLGLPFFSVYLFLMRCFQAMKSTRAMFFHYSIENAVNVILAVVLYQVLEVQGLALSFAIAYAVGCVSAGYDIRRRCRGIGLVSIARSLARTTLLAGVMAIFACASMWLTRDNGAFLQLFVTSAVGAGTYAILALVWSPEKSELLPKRLLDRLPQKNVR